MGVLWKKNYPPVRGFYLRVPSYTGSIRALRLGFKGPCTFILCTLWPQSSPYVSILGPKCLLDGYMVDLSSLRSSCRGSLKGLRFASRCVLRFLFGS